jgi:hypothetical protein
MKNNRIPVGFGLLVIVVLVIWWRSFRPTTQFTQQQDAIETNQVETTQMPVQQTPANPVPIVASNLVPGTSPGSFIEQRVNQQLAELERGKDEWRTPIEFYGKVVDENDQPVEGAQITFGTTDLSPTGTSDYPSMSDAQGLFSITGIQGKLLTTKVSKTGYYTSKRDNASFYYAGQNENFIPEVGNPVIFHLRKHGEAAQLVRFHKTFRVPRDGTPILIDLASGNLATTTSAGLKVECWTQKPESKGDPFDWKCRITVPGGGFQSNNEEFGFLAPTGGYMESDEIDMTIAATGHWQSDITRNYFILTADGRYGRLTFRMIAGGDHFCRVESYFNPSGSRNLENRDSSP